MSRGVKAVSAAVSVAMLVPIVTLTAMLLLGTMMQSQLSQGAAADAAFRYAKGEMSNAAYTDARRMRGV